MKASKFFAQRLQSLREAAGLSQQELAVRADLSMSLVAKMEQGKKADPRLSTLLALAHALDRSPGALLDALAPPAEQPEQANEPDTEVKKPKKKKKKAAH